MPPNGLPGRSHILLLMVILLLLNLATGIALATPLGLGEPAQSATYRLFLPALRITGAPPPTPAVYVDPINGDDANDGSSWEQALRSAGHCATTAPAGARCVLGTGTYRELLRPNDNLTIEPAPNASVVISALDLLPVATWQPHAGQILRTSLTLNSGLKGNQLFLNGALLREARWPNASSSDLFDNAWAIAAAGTTGESIVATGLPAENWSGAVLRYQGGSNPFALQTAVVSASTATTITFDDTGWMACPSFCAEPGGRFSLVGVLAALDQPGEWVYDTASKTLYLWPPDGADLSTIEVKQRDLTVDLRDRANVTLKGIGLLGGGVTMNASSASNTLDGITARYISHYEHFGGGVKTFTRNTGIQLRGQGHTVRDSQIEWSAGNGILVGGNYQTVENNLIRFTGYGGSYATAILVATEDDPVGHRIRRNTIHDTGRDGISIDWNGGVTPTTGDSLRDVEFAYNRIYRYARLSGDSGGIYACCYLNTQLSGTQSRIHHNWISDTGYTRSDGVRPSGIYIDNASAGFLIDHNVLWGNQLAGVYLHGGSDSSRDNAVRNNTMINGQTQGRSLYFSAGGDAARTVIADNRHFGLLGIARSGGQLPEGITLHNNGPTAAGAETFGSQGVGCDFDGCGGVSPPTFAEPTLAGDELILASGYLTATDKVWPVTSGFSIAGGRQTIAYPLTTFTTQPTKLHVRYAVTEAYAGGTLLVRTGSATGPVVAQVPILSSGSYSVYREDTVTVTGTVQGTVKLYLTIESGGLALAHLHFRP
jgi:hypothetical protein